MTQHPLYGTSLFFCRKSNNPTKLKNVPSDFYLGFNSAGVSFLGANDDGLLEEEASFGFADIYRWGGSSTQFSLIIYDAESESTFELTAYTNQAHYMASHVMEYINAIMEATS